MKVINTNPILVTFKANYADEFDVEGFTIFDEAEWIEHLAKVETLFAANNQRQFARYFAINEAIIFKNFDEYKQAFTVKSITHDEEDTIKKLFGTRGCFSYFLMIEE